MTNHLMVWVSGQYEGPEAPKSTARKQGVVTKTKCPMTEDEFQIMQNILQKHMNSLIWQYVLH
jgi:hypothetical protein